MSEHPIEGLMTTAMSSIQDMIDVNTIIGEPIETSNNIVIIPISKVSFGFAAGGSEFSGETIDEYSKRLSKYCKLNILELPDQKKTKRSKYNIGYRLEEEVEQELQ